MTARAFQNRTELETLQLRRLRPLIGQLLESNEFYGQRLRTAGIDASIDCIDSFISRMPLTTKKELVADQHAHPPYGSNMTFPLDAYVRLHQTSSTTGAPLRWLDTSESWSAMTDDWVEVLQAAGATARDRLLAAFSFGPFIGFWLAYEAAIRMGCLVIPGGAMSSLTRLRALEANDVTFLCCTPTYAVRLGETAAEHGIDLSQSSVRTIIVGGEPGGSVPAVRARIQALWPTARLFDHHGMTEIGPATYECPANPGRLHLMESSMLCEVIDVDSGEPITESERDGELVVTTLMRTGSPLLRYRTGDLVRRGSEPPCSCGRYTMVLRDGILGRTDDMVFVRGVNVYPSTIDQIVCAEPHTAEYRVEISEDRGMTELRIFIEPSPNCPDTDALRESIVTAIRGRLNLRIPVEIVEQQSLPRFEFKSKRWVRTGREIPA